MDDDIYLVFLSFRDVPGLGKYGFWCSENSADKNYNA